MLQLPQLYSITGQYNTILRDVDFEKGIAHLDIELDPVTAQIRIKRPENADAQMWRAILPLHKDRVLRRIQLGIKDDRFTMIQIMVDTVWYEVHDSVE